MRGAPLLLVLCLAAHARADSRDDRARAEYQQGKVDFDRQKFDSAYEHFKRAYMISERPAFLFNMALALEELGRPHYAAETLRSYLRITPKDPDRAGIEARIETLEEKQRILDREKAPPPPSVVAPAPPPPAPEKPTRTALIVGVSVGAGAVVVLALGLGLGFGLDPGHTESSLGAWRATR